MSKDRVCSKLVAAVLEIQIKCGHCQAINHVREDYTPNNDPTHCDVDAIKCWSCYEESLIDEGLLEIYLEWPDESVNSRWGVVLGRRPS